MRVFIRNLFSSAALQRLQEQLHGAVAERQQAEEALRQVEHLAALGTFATSIAHELNNLLGAVAVNAEHASSLLRTPDALNEVTECLADIHAVALRCAEIVQRVFSYAREGAPNKAAVALHPIIHLAHDLTRRYAAQHGVQVSLILAPTSPCIWAHAGEMELVLVNLIRSAVEAAQTGGQVTVRTAVAAEEVRIFIQDTGIGLTPAECARAFDPFYTSHQDAGGTGIGLSMAHRIMTEHGGTIDLQSVAGHGATVCLCLPLAPDESTPQT